MGILLTSSLRSALQVSYAACMRTHTPAPSPNSLPQPNRYGRRDRFALVQNIIQMLTGDAEELRNLGLCPASGWNNILAQQSAGMGWTASRITLGDMNRR